MASFSYTALDPSGDTVTGLLDAASRSDAFRELEERDLTPVDLKSALGAARADRGGAGAVAGEEETPSTVKLKRAQLIFFTEELADLLDAGLHLQQALGVLAEQQDHPNIRTVSLRIRDRLREGEPLSTALAAVSPSFDDLYTNLVAAGEASGSLTEILRRLADNLTVLYELQKKFVSALIYPAVMVGACVLLTVVFVAVLVPQLSDLLSKTGQQLPLVTRVLVAVGNFLASYWWVILTALGGVAGIFRLAIAGPKGRLWWDGQKLRIPLIGAVFETRYYAGLCQALGNLVSNGVALHPALRLMVRATPNLFFRGLLEGVVEDVSSGDSLSLALRKAKRFPKLLSDMVAVGEQTGRLGHALQKAAKRYDKELDGKIRRMTGLISPVIIIFLAGVVTVVAYSIVTSIFSAVSGIRGRS